VKYICITIVSSFSLRVPIGRKKHDEVDDNDNGDDEIKVGITAAFLMHSFSRSDSIVSVGDDRSRFREI
jgi:hypothetical protein